jgi:hypothetical protein
MMSEFLFTPEEIDNEETSIRAMLASATNEAAKTPDKTDGQVYLSAATASNNGVYKHCNERISAINVAIEKNTAQLQVLIAARHALLREYSRFHLASDAAEIANQFLAQGE